MKNQMFVCKKRSGNYIVSEFERSEWETIVICNNPKELLLAVHKLRNGKVIKSEYTKSQLTTLPMLYTKSDAVKAFGLSASKMVIEQQFI